jgi:hypothetical protein
MGSGQVRHERDQAAKQSQRVEVDGDGAVTEPLLESDAHETACQPCREVSVSVRRGPCA